MRDEHGRLRRIGITIAALVALSVMGVASNASAATITPVTNTVGIPSDQVGSTTALCPARTQVSAAGFATTTNPDQGVVIASMIPSPAGVSVTAVNFGNDGQLSGTAYCAQVPKKKKKKKKHAKKGTATVAKKKKKKKKKKAVPLTQVSATTSLTGLPEGSAIATCPPNTTVRTGGFSTPVSPDGSLQAIVKSGTLLGAGQWRVAADASGDPSAPASVTAIALCGAGPLVTAATATTELTSETPFTATATCPPGTSVVFGGFEEHGDSTFNTYVSGLARTTDSTWQMTDFPFEAGSITSIGYCAF
jgi:hypothetical protein